MSDHTTSDPRATLSKASQAERQTWAASRWFPRYPLLMGVLAFALIVTVEVFFPRAARGGTPRWPPGDGTSELVGGVT